MGHTTYFDCVLQASDAPALLVAGVSERPPVVLGPQGGAARLRGNGTEFDLADCPQAGRPVDAAALAALLAGGMATLETAAVTHSFGTDGFAAALDLVRERLD